MEQKSRQYLLRITEPFLTFTEKESVQNKFKKLRDKYSINEDGLPFDPKDRKGLLYGWVAYRPKNWGLYRNLIEYKKLNADLERWTKTLPEKFIVWEWLIRIFFFHNQLPDEEILSKVINSKGLCDLVDEKGELERIKKNRRYGDFFLAVKDKSSDFYPITLGISAYATPDAVYKYLKDHGHRFASLRKKYRNENVHIGTLRFRADRDKQNFIWKNRELPNKRIRDLGREKFGDHNFFDEEQVKALKHKMKKEREG
jgi:hypothetical protein